MSIKLKYFCLAHSNYPDQARLWMTVGRKKWTHPLWRLTGTRKGLTLLPPFFSIKEAWILTRGRWFFGTLVHHLLRLLAFWIKSLFLDISWFTGLSCGEKYKLGLGNRVLMSVWYSGISIYGLFPIPNHRAMILAAVRATILTGIGDGQKRGNTFLLVSVGILEAFNH